MSSSSAPILPSWPCSYIFLSDSSPSSRDPRSLVLFIPSSSSLVRSSLPERNHHPHTCTRTHGTVVRVRLPLPALLFVPSRFPVHSHCSHSLFSTDRTLSQVSFKVLFLKRRSQGCCCSSHAACQVCNRAHIVHRRCHTQGQGPTCIKPICGSRYDISRLDDSLTRGMLPARMYT